METFSKISAKNDCGLLTKLLNLSSNFEIPIIATHEVYYLDEDMYEAHDALLCIKNKTYINDKDRIRLSKNHNLKSDIESNKSFY